ncbi:MAG: TetR/AcrR family transcriptional regulator [Candidatus Binatia bacterium]
MGARDEILEKAAYLFSTQGYRATSLAQVARAANVSKALVLWHFESKEQLFRSALQHFLAPYEIDDQRLAGLSEYAQIERLIDDYYEFLAEHLSSVKFLFAQVLREDESASEILSHVRRLYHIYHGLLTSILEAGKEKGVFAEGVCPADEAALITASLNGLFVQQ